MLQQPGASQAVCCALGSYDNSLSVWLSCRDRTVVVVKDLFSQHVTDITWARQGLVLAAASADGTVAFVRFDTTDIGTPVASKLTGGARAATASAADDLAEDPAMLRLLEERRQKAASLGGLGDASTSAGPAERAAAAPVVHTLQARVRGQSSTGGARPRIAPQPVAPSASAPAAVAPVSASSTTTSAAAIVSSTSAAVSSMSAGFGSPLRASATSAATLAPPAVSATPASGSAAAFAAAAGPASTPQASGLGSVAPTPVPGSAVDATPVTAPPVKKRKAKSV